jgi:predicted molibdopterin-dependent oxidoreductase YjgC
MVVSTNSPRVLAARKAVVEMLLIRHPLDCFSCESNGRCELQNLAYELGIEKSPFTDEGDVCTHFELDNTNPFFIRDMNKCILCGRCVRACDWRAGYHAIDFQYRGIHTQINPPIGTKLEDEASDCVFCGQCIQVCPVGALVEKKAVGQGRPWQTHVVRTTCPYCGVGCQLDLHMNGENIARVTGTEDLVASRLKEVMRKHGPDAVGGVSCARSINEDSYSMQKLYRMVFNTNNIDHCARV